MSEKMPEGFTDQTAWDAIHWRFAPVNDDGTISVLDAAVIGWQRDSQERVRAAIAALPGFVGGGETT